MKKSTFKNMMRLMKLVRPLSGYMALAVLLGAAGFLCAIFIPVFGAAALLSAMGYSLPIGSAAALACAGIFAAARGILKYAEQAGNHYIAFTLLAILRDQMFAALRRLCPAKLEGKDKGDLISMITSDIELLEVFYAHTISPVLIAFLVSLMMTALIAVVHPLLGLIAFSAYLTIGLALPLIAAKLGGDNAERFRAKSGEMSAFVLDSLRGAWEILQFDAGAQRTRALDEQSDTLLHYEQKQKQAAGIHTAIAGAVVLVFDMLTLLAGAALYRNGAIEFDGFLLSVVAIMSSFGPVLALAQLGSTLQNTFAAADRILRILDEEPVVRDVDHQPDITFDGASLAHVDFSYGGAQILSNVSLDVKERGIVGVSGKSGSGKSTMLKLLMRFWDVQQGAVSISERNIRDINTANLRDMESFIMQDPHLFQDSIRNNLLIARQDATDEAIVAACKKASIHDLIMRLPRQYDTPVGELGDTLSGGEKQRLSLARALLHDAPFLLLDEPTSNLDSLNEAIILQSILAESSEKFVVLVSHRPSALRIADMVYDLKSGRLS